MELLETIGAAALALLTLRLLSLLTNFLVPFLRPLPPKVTVPLLEKEALDVLPHCQK